MPVTWRAIQPQWHTNLRCSKSIARPLGATMSVSDAPSAPWWSSLIRMSRLLAVCLRCFDLSLSSIWRWLVGTLETVRARLKAYEVAGVQELIMIFPDALQQES